MTHLVIYGEASQTLRHDAPGFVASATYEITDLTKAQSDPARVLASGAATTPTWSLTLDEPAGPSQPNAARVPVTLTAGPSLADAAVLTSSDGAFEPVTIQAIETDDYVDAGSFLAGSYVAGATVQGRTITAAVPIALYDFELALDDQRPIRIEWTYTIGDALALVTEPIQLARQNLASASTGPAIRSLLLGYPDLAGRILTGLTLTGLADYSLERVGRDFAALDIDPAALMLGVQGRMLLVAKIIHEAAVRGYSPGMRPLDDFVDESERDYTTQLEAVSHGLAGAQAIKLDNEAVARARPDQTYRSPIGAM